MTFLEFKMNLFKPFYEARMANTVKRTYIIRKPIDLVRKYEEMKFKHLESQRIKPPKNGDEAYFKTCKDILAWVINADKTDS